MLAKRRNKSRYGVPAGSYFSALPVWKTVTADEARRICNAEEERRHAERKSRRAA